MDLKQLEKALIKNKSAAKRIIGIRIVLYFISFSIILLLKLENFFHIIIFMLFLVTGFDSYRKANKKNRLIVGQIINLLNPNIRYMAEGEVLRESIVESNLFPINPQYRYDSSDLLHGDLGKYTLLSADVHSYYIQGSGKSSHTVTVFKGRWIILNIKNKDFAKTKLVVREENKFFKNPISNLTKFETEGIVFNEKFNVYTDNHLEMLKVLKPQQIHAISELEKKYDGRLAFGISNNLIHLAIWDESDLFELIYTNSIEDIKKDLDSVLEKAEQAYKIIK